MNHLTYHWKKRSFIIMVISTVLCGLLWLLSLSEWAIAMNDVVREPHNDRPDAPALLMLIMPLIKVTMLTIVPAAICIAVMKTTKWFRKMNRTVTAR